MRFAYLIIIHNNVEQVRTLLGLLDDKRNDIYIHIDKKSKITPNELHGTVKYSKLFCYSKYRVAWGSISQVKCEIFLLQQAVSQKYDYYHLLSGADLPLHCQDYIHHFFQENRKTGRKEYIHFESSGISEKETNNYYYFFYELISCLKDKGKAGKIKRILRNIERHVISVQKALHIRRLKFYCGSNWFSITDELACEVVKCRRAILRNVWFTISSDEIFLQTFIVSKGYDNYCYDVNKDSDYKAIMRYIDWNRGEPYVWRENDYEELVNSPFLFARKFDSTIDSKIIQKIADRVTAEKNYDASLKKYI